MEIKVKQRTLSKDIRSPDQSADKPLFKRNNERLSNRQNNAFYCARYTFSTIAAKRGIRDSIAEHIMGHAESNDIADVYMNLYDKGIVQEMLDKWVVA